MTALLTPAKGPLSAVLAELEAGTPTVNEIARHSRLQESVVRAAIDHLVRAGRVEAKELSIGCPPSGCGGCASAGDDGAPACGLAAPVAGRRAGLVTLTLSRR